MGSLRLRRNDRAYKGTMAQRNRNQTAEMTPSPPFRQSLLNKRTREPSGEGRATKIRLDLNENTAGCSPAVRKALARLSAKQIATYPDYGAPSRRIASRLGVRREEMILTNGGDEALRVFFDAFVDPATAVLLCDPTFPMYRFWAEVFGAQIVALRYTDRMEFPLDDFIRQLASKPRLAFIANPNNPTGSLLPLDSLRKILDAATETALVIDEAYVDFSRVTVLPWCRRHPNLFVVRTFSKVAGLAGLRLGCVLGHKDSVRILRGALAPFGVNLAALAAAEAALADGKTLVRYITRIERVRSEFSAALCQMGVRVFPSVGNFLLADFGSDGPALFRRLGRKGILLRDRPDIGPGFIRITIGTPAEMSRVLREIKRAIAGGRSGNNR
jgi:histidinol-phosphate aminotransferase